MVNIIMDAIICGFELYMLWGLGSNLLRINNRKMALRFGINALIYLGYIAVNSLNSTTYNFILVPMIYMAFSFWNFSGSALKRFCVVVCYYTLAILPEFIFALFANVDSGFAYRMSHYNETVTFVIILVMKMITFVLIKCIEQIHKRKYYEEEGDKIFLSLLVLPVATIVFLGGLFYSDLYISSTGSKNMVLLGAVLLIFANVFMFYLFNQMLIHVNKAQKLERLYLKSKMEKKYLEQLSKADEERRKLLHDVNKYVRAAASCVAMDDVQGAKEIFEKWDLKIRETRPKEYSKNKMLNVIMTDRIQIADEEGISLSIKIEPEVDFAFMNEIDLIAILGNLLDNAFEAAKPCGRQGFVSVSIFTENQGHFLILNVDNNYVAEPVLSEKGYMTIKKDRKNHGIGIHTVERIVKRYNGRVIIDVKEAHKLFTVTIIFQL